MPERDPSDPRDAPDDPDASLDTRRDSWIEVAPDAIQETPPGYLPPHPDDPEITGEDPVDGPQPARSTLEAVVMLFLGALSLGMLGLVAVALFR